MVNDDFKDEKLKTKNDQDWPVIIIIFVVINVISLQALA